MNTKNERGFGLIEVLVAILVVGLIGLGVWYVLQAQTVRSPTPQGSQQTDPYAGWQTYCDELQKVCFKYPSDWAVQTDHEPERRWAHGISPDGAIEFTYRGENTIDGYETPFYTAVIQDLAKPDERYKIVGGYHTNPGKSPAYWLVGGAFLPTNMHVGKISDYGDTPRFKNTDGYLGSFTVGLTKPMADTTASREWFTSKDANVALLLLKSFYRQE